MGRTVGEHSPVKGTPVTVVASRGGYSSGSPRSPFEYAQSYLPAVLAEMLQVDIDVNIDIIVSELTLAISVPAMSHLIPLAEKSRDKALGTAAQAKALAQRLTA